MPAVLLTGRPGCGKTTLICGAVRDLGTRAGGFYTEEVRAAGRRAGPSTGPGSRPAGLRTGFDLITLDGRRARLASVDSRSRLRVSSYGVDVGVMDGPGAEAVRSAVAGADLIVIDEIGKMELFSQAFQEAVMEALESGKPVLGAVMLGPHPFADAVKARPDVELITLSEEGRAQAARRVRDRLRQLLGER